MDFRYDGGVEVRLRFLDRRPYVGPGLGAEFVGDKGKIEINRNRYRSNPPELTRDGPAPTFAKKWEGEGWVVRGQIRDWIDGVHPTAPRKSWANAHAKRLCCDLRAR